MLTGPRQNGAMPWKDSPRPTELARAVLNAVNLTTPLGLAVAAAGRSQLRGTGQGLLIAERGRLGLRGAGAFTIGNVVVVPRVTLSELSRRQPDVLAHESAHAWQYAACLGLPFLPLYALASGWSWLRTGDVAAANLFETTAGLDRGGYVTKPKNNAGLKRMLGWHPTADRPDRGSSRRPE